MKTRLGAAPLKKRYSPIVNSNYYWLQWLACTHESSYRYKTIELHTGVDRGRVLPLHSLVTNLRPGARSQSRSLTANPSLYVGRYCDVPSEQKVKLLVEITIS